MSNYILTPRGVPHLEKDLMKWARWYETADRHVGDDLIKGARVSTVFLGIDHSFHNGPPILWETMVFGGPLDQEQDRCSGSRKQAEAMHAAMLKRLRR